MRFRSFILLFSALFPAVCAWAQADSPTQKYGPEFEFRGNLHGVLEIGCPALGLGVGGALAAKEHRNENHSKLVGGLIEGGEIAGGAFSAFLLYHLCLKHYQPFLQKRLADELVKKGLNVVEVMHKSSHYGGPRKAYRVIYPEGWYFQVATDANEIEVQASPATSAQWAARKERLQKDLFETAKKVGLKPSRLDFLSNGHISLGFSDQFGKDPELFRNFIVDQLNHHELANGIFSHDRLNAEHPMNSRGTYEEIADVIQDFDLKRGNIVSSEGLAKRLENVLGFGSIDLRTISREVPARRRVEMRSHRAQLSAEEFTLHTELYDARIRYLKTLKGPIPLTSERPTRDPAEMVRRFKQYVEETGEPIEKYLPLLPKKYHRYLFRSPCLISTLEQVI